MFLMLTVKKCGAEGIETAFVGQTGGVLQSSGIAVQAALALPENHLTQEVVQVIIFPNDQMHVEMFCHDAERFESSSEFLIGMNVGVVKVSVHVPAGCRKDPGRI
jgi:hypothetical protein